MICNGIDLMKESAKLLLTQTKKKVITNAK